MQKSFVIPIIILVSFILHIHGEDIKIDILDLNSSLKILDDALEQIRNNEQIPPSEKFFYGSVLYEKYLKILKDIAIQRKKENDQKMDQELKNKNQQEKQSALRQSIYKSLLATGNSAFHTDFHTLRY
jgi:cell division protein FtsB